MSYVSNNISVFQRFNERRAAVLPGGIPLLLALFKDGAEFESALSPRKGEAGELTLRTRYSPPPGTPVVLEVGWTGLPNRVLLRAITGKRGFSGGLAIRLDGTEVKKRDFLRQVARGEVDRLHPRAASRYCVRLPVQWRRFGATVLVSGMADDLSSGGVLISCKPASLVPGDRVAVRLDPEHALLDLVLTGVVQHIRTPGHGDGQGDDDGKMAFGVRFEYRSSAEQRTLRALLRAFASSGVTLAAPRT
jgi:PilZ domain